MLVMRPHSYRSPMRKKIGRMIPIYFPPDVITKHFIHWRGSTHPDTDRNVETLIKVSRGPMVCLVVRI
jgi:hypothetical protein